jgi:hypothetical protein
MAKHAEHFKASRLKRRGGNFIFNRWLHWKDVWKR